MFYDNWVITTPSSHGDVEPKPRPTGQAISTRARLGLLHGSPGVGLHIPCPLSAAQPACLRGQGHPWVILGKAHVSGERQSMGSVGAFISAGIGSRFS